AEPAGARTRRETQALWDPVPQETTDLTRAIPNAPNLDEVVEECRPTAHVGERGRRGAVDVGAAGHELVPVDPGGHRDARPDAPLQRHPGPEAPAVVVDLGPVAGAEPAARGVLIGQLDRRLAGGGAMAGRAGERRVEELRP